MGISGRGTCKVAGGKLVGVNVIAADDGRITSCSVDGDFFVDASDEEAEALLDDLGRALAAGLHSGDDVSRALLAHPAARLIGIGPDAIRTAFLRALEDAGVEGRPAMGNPTGDPIGTFQAPDAEAGRDSRADAWRRRWSRLHPRIIHDAPRDPHDQMEVDERWARLTAAGMMPPTLRFWEWASPAVVIGRFQSASAEVDLDRVRLEGFTVVRRCTGGGAMFIEPGDTITYSLIAPLSFVSDVDVVTSYRLCDQWLVDALEGVGIHASFSGLNDISSDQGKIGGAAQRRFPPVDGGPGAVLHHVTLAYDIDAVRMGRILTPDRRKLADKAVRSAVRRVDPMRSQTGLPRDEIVERLIRSAATTSGTAAAMVPGHAAPDAAGDRDARPRGARPRPVPGGDGSGPSGPAIQ
ncbi:lipoate--protein ligase family protein [uncultured Bifidobacterium sp.]|uniref:lipoate--protein ligase family protein n=1 Tax=uncultured Bifidobacterium sp. TaxID=165187 RepID=UPI0028DD2C7C|nr:lipoate--protein ligase family protein [uncultured Bifidobacterium sp.]